MTNCFEKSKQITMFTKYGCSKYEKRKKILSAMIALRTLYARCLRAVNKLQQLLAQHISIMVAIKTQWKRRVDNVETL